MVIYEQIRFCEIKSNLNPHASMAYRLYDSCSSEKQLYVVHGANHAESYRKDPEGYENVIAQFVEEHSEALKKEY